MAKAKRSAKKPKEIMSIEDGLYHVTIVAFRCAHEDLERIAEENLPESLLGFLRKDTVFFSPQGVGICTPLMQHKEHGAAVCLWIDGTLTKNGQREVLQHELLHAALHVLMGRGLEITHESQEALTYYMDMLSRLAVDEFDLGVR